ncbi:uncharacterized protein isoform X2 [Choristoneura fumiferana]|uniref:uncharacterized protein isoform X2 n=1 Tax=Choristoneura fumiferana TaxID=7141 RepID=UPI003D1577E0
MAEKFAGYSDVDDFIHQFETIAIIKNWSADQKRVAIALYLEGPALSWYKANFTTLESYDLIKKGLVEQFPSQEDYAQSFYYRKQEPKEPLLSFYYDLEKLALKAGITEDGRFIKHFIKSINSQWQFHLASRLFASKEELRKTILQLCDVFSTELYMKTHKVELPINITKDYQHSWEQGDAPPLRFTPRSEYDTSQTPPTMVVPQEMQQGTSRMPYGRYNLRPRQLQPVPQQHQGDQGNNDGFQINTIFSSEFPDVCTIEKNSLNTFVPVELSGRICKALVDSGANVSLISVSLAEEIDLKYEHKLSDPLRVAGGSMIQPIGIVNTYILIDNYYCRISLLVINDRTNFCILGQDFLTANNAMIDFSSHTLTLNKKFRVNFIRKFNDTNDFSLLTEKVCANQVAMKEVECEQINSLTVENKARSVKKLLGFRALNTFALGSSEGKLEKSKSIGKASRIDRKMEQKDGETGELSSKPERVRKSENLRMGSAGLMKEREEPSGCYVRVAMRRRENGNGPDRFHRKDQLIKCRNEMAICSSHAVADEN